MNVELLAQLEQKVEVLIDRHQVLQQENRSLAEENRRLLSEREQFKERIDAMLVKLEEI